jgi:hypothetical protein
LEQLGLTKERRGSIVQLLKSDAFKAFVWIVSHGTESIQDTVVVAILTTMLASKMLPTQWKKTLLKLRAEATENAPGAWNVLCVWLLMGGQFFNRTSVASLFAILGFSKHFGKTEGSVQKGLRDLLTTDPRRIFDKSDESVSAEARKLAANPIAGAKELAMDGVVHVVQNARKAQQIVGEAVVH